MHVSLLNSLSLILESDWLPEAGDQQLIFHNKKENRSFYPVRSLAWCAGQERNQDRLHVRRAPNYRDTAAFYISELTLRRSNPKNAGL